MRAIDDAGIRTTAFMIEAEICVLRRRTESLIEKFDALKDELPFADPVKDRALDRFLIELSRGIIALQSLAEIEETAKAMQKFGLLADSVIPAEAGIQSESEIQHVGLRQEVSHA